ncbi:MAG: thiamine/thiamine pyrophosphate ABC transporter, permease protein [Rhizobiales bacterium]|nr:thiamine/thiamine pyrophosphate ABC transporter permease [Hyphomicrobiales bacterium]NRB14587.1 thiamine/thiamine pyrophosphate ABC transporter, permease protein [Hyphomicrobiales bacterium]
MPTSNHISNPLKAFNPIKALKLAYMGYLILAFIIGLAVLVFVALLGHSSANVAGFFNIFGQIIADDYIRHITYFSFLQAGLSTFVAILIAIPVARFLYRRQFWGKSYLLKLFILAFIMPTMVSVFGIIAVHGRQGIFNDFYSLFGFERVTYLYGLTGILLAHIFINMPFSARIFLSELDNIPAEYWRLSKQLGLSEWQIFKQIEWPIMRLSLPSLASLLFILHFTSFATVLTLGGGPSATTLEVAIYQSLKFDFDLAKGASLAILQLSFCLLFSLFLHRFSTQINLLHSIGLGNARPKPHGKTSYIADTLVIFIIIIALILPLSSVFYNALAQTDFSVFGRVILWRAVNNSLILSLCAAGFATFLALSLLLSKRALADHKISNIGYHLFSSVGNVILIVPSLVFGMGLFLLLRPYFNIFEYGLHIILVINALMALPYMLKTLSPAIENMAKQHSKLSRALGISRLDRWRIIDWPTLRKPLAHSVALAATISFGDFGVIALFGNDQTITLPMLLYQSIGDYRSADGAVIACILVILAFGLYTLIDRIIGGRHAKA